MHRDKTVARILLILSVVHVAVATPAILCQRSLDVDDDVTPASEKRGSSGDTPQDLYPVPQMDNNRPTTSESPQLQSDPPPASGSPPVEVDDYPPSEFPNERSYRLYRWLLRLPPSGPAPPESPWLNSGPEPESSGAQQLDNDPSPASESGAPHLHNDPPPALGTPHLDNDPQSASGSQNLHNDAPPALGTSQPHEDPHTASGTSPVHDNLPLGSEEFDSSYRWVDDLRYVEGRPSPHESEAPPLRNVEGAPSLHGSEAPPLRNVEGAPPLPLELEAPPPPSSEANQVFSDATKHKLKILAGVGALVTASAGIGYDIYALHKLIKDQKSYVSAFFPPSPADSDI